MIAMHLYELYFRKTTATEPVIGREPPIRFWRSLVLASGGGSAAKRVADLNVEFDRRLTEPGFVLDHWASASNYMHNSCFWSNDFSGQDKMFYDKYGYLIVNEQGFSSSSLYWDMLELFGVLPPEEEPKTKRILELNQ